MGKIKVEIKRQLNKESEPYFETFTYEGDCHIPVLNLLEYINLNHEKVADNPKAFRRIQYECSCEQALCGACAMVINDVPGLACKIFCDEAADKSGCIRIEPLSKFPVVCDLAVDRSEIYESMKNLKLWVEGDAVYNEKTHNQQYQAAQCLQCGCCLEACPNYAKGDFYVGAVGAVNAMNMLSLNGKGEHKDDMKKQYKSKFFNGCTKMGACEKVCPAEIPIMGLLSAGNRISVWRFWQLINGSN